MGEVTLARNVRCQSLLEREEGEDDTEFPKADGDRISKAKDGESADSACMRIMFFPGGPH